GPADVEARYFGPGGSPGVEQRVNQTTAGRQVNAAVAGLGDGKFLVAWGDFTRPGGDVYARRVVGAPDTAPPAVVSVTVGGRDVPPGRRFVHAVEHMNVSFFEPISAAGGTTGAGSVTHPRS